MSVVKLLVVFLPHIHHHESPERSWVLVDQLWHGMTMLQHKDNVLSFHGHCDLNILKCLTISLLISSFLVGQQWGREFT